MGIKEIVNWLVDFGGLTQREIAERVGFSGATISDVATGKIGHTRPSYDLVTKLQALHADVLEEQEKAKAQASATA